MRTSGAASLVLSARAPRFPSQGLAVFWLLGSEFATFAGLAVVFMAGRQPDWIAARHDLNVGLAGVATLLMLASAFTMAQARRVSRHAGGPLRLWLGATQALGAGFLVCVVVEVEAALSAGHGMGTHRFWAHWFLLTGMHASRVAAGLVAMAIVGGQRSAPRHMGALGLYWWFVCLVCLAYFPMLYGTG